MSCCSACAHGRKCSGKKKRRNGRRARRRMPSWNVRQRAAARLRRQGRIADSILALSGKGPAFKKNPRRSPTKKLKDRLHAALMIGYSPHFRARVTEGWGRRDRSRIGRVIHDGWTRERLYHVIRHLKALRRGEASTYYWKKRNPLTRREAARALSVARKHGWFARKAARVGQIGVYEHHLGRMKGMRDVVRMFIDRRR